MVLLAAAVCAAVPAFAAEDAIARKELRSMRLGLDNRDKIQKLRVEGNAVIGGIIEGAGTGAGVAVARTNVTAVESAFGNVQKTVLTLASTPMVVTLGHVAYTNWSGSAKIYDFPTGRIDILGVVVDNLTAVTNPTCVATSDVTYALGSVAGSGALTGTEVDLCPTNGFTQLTNYFDKALAASAQFDGTTTPLDVYLNCSISSNNVALATTNAVSGKITIHWINLGDY
jgi:hypothetical protein